MRIDLILHFLAGFFIASAITLILIRCDDLGLLWVGFAIAVLAGLVKELYDKYVQHEIFDWKDFALTCAGGGAALWVDLVKLG